MRYGMAGALAGLLAAVAWGQRRTEQFNEWKFGMFIHWGPYSQASVEASWPIMRPTMTPGKTPQISEEAYRALATTFNPVEYDPRAWVKLAKEAGQRYMVFTSKHHDGFSMFDSAYTDYKITRTPYKKDIVAMLSEAAREEKMPLGFYYSPPDMNHTGFRDTSKLSATNWQGQPERAEWALYLDYMEMQVRELLTRYGDVAIIWFDGLGNQGKYDGWRFHRMIREIQPKTLVNNRIGLPGDYDTPEQRIPKEVPMAGGKFRPWETCMTINGTWAYNKNDLRYKSATELVRALIDVASKGGNFLLNVGPTPEGTIQPEFVERLRAMGVWLKVNGEAIYGTTYGPWQGLAFGRSTAKGKTAYLHVFDWPASGKLEVAGVKERIAKARMLAGGRAVKFRQSGGMLELDLEGHAAGEHATVIAVEMR